jgi:hypothetical protein
MLQPQKNKRPDTPLAITPDPTDLKGGTYYASSTGRVGRLSGSKIGNDISAVQNESIDTTGYAKGKKDFTKTINRTFNKPTTQKVNREDVPKVINELKKGATRIMDTRSLTQKQR